MTVTLTAEQEQFIAEQLKDGHYRSASDVIAQSLGMLRAQEEFIRSNAVELREKIASGLEQIRRGETVEGEDAIRALREKLHRRERGGQWWPMSSYRYSSDANADIEEIAFYIFDLNPIAAHHFLHLLEKPANCWQNTRFLGVRARNLVKDCVHFPSVTI